MRTNRLATVIMAGIAAVSLFGLLLWTAVAIQAESVIVGSGEMREASDLQAQNQTRSFVGSSGLLLVADNSNRRIMAFDPVTGNPVDVNLIVVGVEAPTGTVNHAVLGPDGHIYVSIGSVVRKYDWDGNHLGIFAPAGGENIAIMQNIRGIAFRPNGHLLVTVTGGANANSVVEFDLNGVFVGKFIMDDENRPRVPNFIHGRADNDWLVSSPNDNLIKRYNWTTGDFIGPLATINSSPQQIHQLANGNLLVANLTGVQMGIVELMPGGQLVGLYAAPGLSSYRGVYQLPNGNILAATISGLHEINRSGNLIATRYSGGDTRFISFARLPHIELRQTVGLTSGCANTDMISVPPNTAVTYCYRITNNSGLTLTAHDLTDSRQGVIFTGLPYSIPAGGTAFYTTTAVLTETAVSSAVWTAYNPGPTDVFTATDTATVKVVPPSISLKVTVNDGAGCSESKHIMVRKGTTVTYCFTVFNTGLTTLSRHTLSDTHLGLITPDPDLAFDLSPNASAVIIETAVITEAVTNTATWTAYNPGPTDVATANDSARVSVIVQDLFLPIIMKP
jgi:hypothetical protein